MNKECSYEKAVAEIILFDNSDVITTSGKTYCMGSTAYDSNPYGCRDGSFPR